MDITSTEKQGDVCVTILQLNGKLDGSNHMQLLDEVKKVHNKGGRDLLIDLSCLTFLSSAGIVAIHKTALLFRGISISKDRSGWVPNHVIDRDSENKVQKHVKLLSPQLEVAKTLEITGFKALFEIHTELDSAVASFQ
jgi:anti-anti-sigma factor